MTQLSKKVTIYTCDRCATRGEFTESQQYACWANITTQYKSGSSLLPHGYQADLCTECAADLAQWFKNLPFDAEGKLE
jgi:hypothetical protein